MTNHICYAINFNHGAKQPDVFNSKLGVPPPDSFVIAYDTDGQPASCYGDDIWDMTAYQKIKHKASLNFVSWNNKVFNESNSTITAEIKWLLFLFSFFRDRTYSVGTMHGMLCGLRDMARHCSLKETLPIKLLSNPIDFSIYLNKTNIETKIISSLVSTLTDIGKTKRGFPLLLGSNLVLIGEKLKLDYDKSKQHPVIPTRIYSALITRCIVELEEFETIADRYMQLIDDCIYNPQLGRRTPIKTQNISPKPKQTFSENRTSKQIINHTLTQYDLTDYINNYSQRNNIDIHSILNIGSCLKRMQHVCFILIILFSGMRRSEASRLPYDCIEIYHKHGRKHYRIRGETFKLANDVTESVKWVTDPIVDRVVRIAQKIANSIYKSIGVTLCDEQKYDIDYPLFIGLGYLPFTPHSRNQKRKTPYANSHDLGSFSSLPENFFEIIVEEDIQELEAIDPFRDWRAESKFAIGSRWHYTHHQSRRSLAVYASSSGLVSLQSLRRQLQHITEEMTVYYAKGSLYAKSIVGSKKDHFYHDYQATRPEAQALAYIAQVLLSNEPLFGGHGAFLTHRLHQEGTISGEDRKETIRRHKNGEAAYRSTPLGGCTTVVPCDKKAMRTVTACLDCGKSVIKATGVEKVIKLTRSQLGRLDPSSKEAELKEIDLSKLITLHTKIQNKYNKA